MERLEVVLQLLAIVLPRKAIDFRCGVLLRSKIRLAQPINVHMVQQRREPFPLVCLCSFAYTFKRTVRIVPALCPGRVLPARVPLIEPLPSTASAANPSALFGCFAGTT